MPDGVEYLNNRVEQQARLRRRKEVQVPNQSDLPPDMDAPIPFDAFPHKKTNKDGDATGAKGTIENLECLLNYYGYSVSYNVIDKSMSIRGPRISGSGIQDGAQDAAIDRIVSQAALSGLPKGDVPRFLMNIALGNPINPVTDYLSVLNWDGDDHISRLAETLQVNSIVEPLRNQLLRLWLIQCCAAADGGKNSPNDEAIPKYEYLLVFYGAQGRQKTKWLNGIIPDELKTYFKDGIHLDPNNKDSVETATGYWIVELGELDSTFRKDASRLKAFLSEQQDVYRKSYGRTRNSYQRRTSFCGSVNKAEFLVDETGNRRYWPLAVEEITLPQDAGINMDEVWAQAWDLYTQGQTWWPSTELETELDAHRASFEPEIEHPIIERIHQRYAPFTQERKTLDGAKRMTVSEIYESVWVQSDFGASDDKTLKLIGSYLRKSNLDAYGKPDTTNPQNRTKWLMPPLG